MTSKKATSTKRATIPRSSDITKEFRKDWNRLSKTGRYNMADLKNVMCLLVANDAPLPPQYRDHELTGEWKDYRECHIHGDYLLIYRVDGKGDDQVVIFARIGTHAELFE
jgi:mRNA interferase YafQ